MTNELKRFYYKKSRIQQLKGFCYTVQFGSATKASKHMGLSTTAVTLQIQALEEDLDIKLFKRVGNKFFITEEGKIFYDLAVIQVQGVDSLFEKFHARIKEKKRNTLIIASCNSALSFVLPKYVKKLTEEKEFKGIKISLYNMPGKEAFKKLIEGEVDFAFYPSHGDGKNIPVEIEEEKIFKSKFALFLSKSHPLAKKPKITKKDVEKYEYMMISDKHTFYNPGRSINFKQSQINFRNGSSITLMKLVKENIAIGTGNALWRKVNSNIVFRNIDHLLPSMFYSLFTLKNKQQKESVSYFINELRKDKKDV
ncbi:LysR substrate-binding domain-containing protein [Pseudomonadota bacterium]